MTYNFDEYKKDTLTRPRDIAWSNWKSWKDAVVGEKVQGFIADAFYRPEEKDLSGATAFRPQRGITLKQIDGSYINVGVKDLAYVLDKTDNLRIGDPMTIELSEIKAPVSKGKQGAKIFAYYGKNLPENAGNKTVKELYDEDKKAGGTSDPVVEDNKTTEVDPLADILNS